MFQVPEGWLDFCLLALFVGPRNLSIYIELKKKKYYCKIKHP